MYVSTSDLDKISSPELILPDQFFAKGEGHGIKKLHWAIFNQALDDLRHLTQFKGVVHLTDHRHEVMRNEMKKTLDWFFEEDPGNPHSLFNICSSLDLDYLWIRQLVRRWFEEGCPKPIFCEFESCERRIRKSEGPYCSEHRNMVDQIGKGLVA